MVFEKLGGAAGLEGAGRLVFALIEARNTRHIDLPAPFQVVRPVLVREEVRHEAESDDVHVFACRTSEILGLDRMLDQLMNVRRDGSGVATLVAIPAVDVHIILLQHSCRPNMNTR